MIIDTTRKDEADSGITWIDPADLMLFRDGAGVVRATVRGRRSVIRPAFLRAFPITDPVEFIELREDGGGAVGVLRRLDDVDAPSRAIIEDLLRERYMVPFITEIRGIRQEFGAWIWDVVTDRGERTFTVRNPRDDIRPVPVAGDEAAGVRRIRISDADGNMYEIRDYYALNARSRSLFDRIA